MSSPSSSPRRSYGSVSVATLSHDIAILSALDLPFPVSPAARAAALKEACDVAWGRTREAMSRVEACDVSSDEWGREWERYLVASEAHSAALRRWLDAI